MASAPAWASPAWHGRLEKYMLLGTLFSCLEGCVLAAGCLRVSTFTTSAVSVPGGLLFYFLGGLTNTYIGNLSHAEQPLLGSDHLAHGVQGGHSTFRRVSYKDAIVHGKGSRINYVLGRAHLCSGVGQPASCLWRRRCLAGDM